MHVAVVSNTRWWFLHLSGKSCVCLSVCGISLFLQTRDTLHQLYPTVEKQQKDILEHFRAFWVHSASGWFHMTINKILIAIAFWSNYPGSEYRLLRFCFKEHLKQSIPFVSYLIDSVWLFISLGPLIKDLSVFLTQWHSKLDCCSNTVEI